MSAKDLPRAVYTISENALMRGNDMSFRVTSHGERQAIIAYLKSFLQGQCHLPADRYESF
jgi:hypothetical protein